MKTVSSVSSFFCLSRSRVLTQNKTITNIEIKRALFKDNFAVLNICKPLLEVSTMSSKRAKSSSSPNVVLPLLFNLICFAKTFIGLYILVENFWKKMQSFDNCHRESLFSWGIL